MKKFFCYGAGLLALGFPSMAVLAQTPPATSTTNPAQPATATAGTSGSATPAPSQHKAGDIPGPIDSLQDLQDTARMMFKMADENGDGQISQKEAVDAGNRIVGGFFFNADQNGDGTLTKDEARQARDAFLATKPWLRYALQTARAERVREGKANNTQNQGQNPLKALASTFDANNDQQLSAQELRNAVQTAVQGGFATADTNRDGQLSPAEVNAAAIGLTRQLAQASFQQADKDNNGQISEQEFIQAIEEPAKVAFAVADLNHDGQISQEEAQTARRVVMSKIRSLNFPEPANSPRNMANAALSTPAAPGAPVPTGTTPR